MEKSLFHLTVLNYFMTASDPSFNAIKRLYKQAVKLNDAQYVYDQLHNENTKNNGLEYDLKYFEVIQQGFMPRLLYCTTHWDAGRNVRTAEQDYMFLGIDQYGQTYKWLTHPRKDLLDILGHRHADKMYCDKRDGSTKHIGYIIGGLWITLYKAQPLENVA